MCPSRFAAAATAQSLSRICRVRLYLVSETVPEVPVIVSDELPGSNFAPCLCRGDTVAPAAGHPSPTRGEYLEGYHDRSRPTGSAPGQSALFVRPLCQAPCLQPRQAFRCRARALAPCRRRQGKAARRHRGHARGAWRPRRLSHRHRARLRHRGGGNGDVDDAGRAPGRDAGLGKLRRGLGHGRRQAAQARREAARGTLWGAARSLGGQLRR